MEKYLRFLLYLMDAIIYDMKRTIDCSPKRGSALLQTWNAHDKYIAWQTSHLMLPARHLTICVSLYIQILRHTEINNFSLKSLWNFMISEISVTTSHAFFLTYILILQIQLGLLFLINPLQTSWIKYSFLSSPPRFRKQHCFLEGSQSSSFCRPGRVNMNLKFSMEHWWNVLDRENRII